MSMEESGDYDRKKVRGLGKAKVGRDGTHCSLFKLALALNRDLCPSFVSAGKGESMVQVSHRAGGGPSSAPRIDLHTSSRFSAVIAQ